MDRRAVVPLLDMEVSVVGVYFSLCVLCFACGCPLSDHVFLCFL